MQTNVTYVRWKVLIEWVSAMLLFEILDPPFQGQEVYSLGFHEGPVRVQLQKRLKAGSQDVDPQKRLTAAC